MTFSPDRRRVLGGATATVIGLPVLAACGSGSGDPAADSATGSSSPPVSGTALGAVADVPVGGCAVFADQKVVVTQAAEGDFKAFSAVCTHQGCTVSSSTDGVIPCGCHGSQYSLEDGSVIQGPATAALSEVAITVEGDAITLA